MPAAQQQADIQCSYLYVDRSEPIARTVDLGDGVHVDLDAFGRVHGIERVGGQIDAGALVAALRKLPQLAREAAARDIESWIGSYDDPSSTDAERNAAHGLKVAAKVARSGDRR